VDEANPAGGDGVHPGRSGVVCAVAADVVRTKGVDRDQHHPIHTCGRLRAAARRQRRDEACEDEPFEPATALR
jgi:hypothetical protein